MTDKEGRIYMNNSNDTQHSSMQEQMLNQVPVNLKQEENQMYIPIYQNRYKPDENINI